jgi:hypothetical protein
MEGSPWIRFKSASRLTTVAPIADAEAAIHKSFSSRDNPSVCCAALIWA